MDHLGWVGSPILMNPSSPWSTQNQDIQESLMFSTSSCSYGSMNDPAEIFFPAQELHKTRAYTHRTGEEVHQCAPASDPMSAIESSMANFSMLGKSLYISEGSQETRTANSSNTCTSVEDDEIPANFSNTMNIWSFKNADSSGDSQGKGSPVNELNETVSLTTRSNGQNEPSPILKGGFQMVPENRRKPKRPRWDMRLNCVFNIDFKQPSSSLGVEELDPEAIAQMKEMVYRAAAFRPVTMGMEVVEKPKSKNVRISSDPQTAAARQRERISERVRVLKRLAPGGTKMDTASMLHEAANYLKFLKSQVRALESSPPFSSVPFNQSFPHANPFSTPKTLVKFIAPEVDIISFPEIG